MNENASQPPKNLPGYEELSLPITVPVFVHKPVTTPPKPATQTPSSKSKE